MVTSTNHDWTKQHSHSYNIVGKKCLELGGVNFGNHFRTINSCKCDEAKLWEAISGDGDLNEFIHCKKKKNPTY